VRRRREGVGSPFSSCDERRSVSKRLRVGERNHWRRVMKRQIHGGKGRRRRKFVPCKLASELSIDAKGEIWGGWEKKRKRGRIFLAGSRK